MSTNRPPLPKFPAALRMNIKKTTAGSTDAEIYAMLYHDRAIGAWIAERHCQTGNTELRPPERAILGMAAGLDAWCRYHREAAMSPFGAEQVTRRLFDAFYEALNHDTGRLNARTLHEWSRDLLIACGVDTD